MTTVLNETVVGATTEVPAGSGRFARSRRAPAGFVFVSGYVVLLLLFGVVPVLYSVYLALTKPAGGFA